MPDEYKKFEISEFEKALGVMGIEVENEARKLFPNGILIEGRDEKAQALTKKLIAEKTPVIFQAVFSTDKYLAAADVLKWNDEAGMYDLYEIKMSSTDDEDEEEEDDKPRKVNKKKELQFEYDISFQTNVAKLCGINFNKKYLLRLNRDYVRHGALNLNKLFEETDKTENLNPTFLSATHTEMESAYTYLSNTNMPAGHCDCFYKGRSAHCTTFSLSNPDAVGYTVHDLNRIGNSKNVLRALLDEGILNIEDVSESDERLKPSKAKKGEPEKKARKQNQVKVYRTKEPMIDYDAIRSELSSLIFPLYFLDYETYPTAIPPFDGYHPYQHIVFQYSLHILTEDMKLTHEELLVTEGDPAGQIVAGLRKNIGNVGSVISWYKKFENSRNKELAKLVPNEAEFLLGLVARTYDLMDIVENQHYVHHGFKGSSSIKKVQPVLVPHLAYKELVVRSGTDAIESYRQIVKGEITGKDLEQKKKDMLTYCKYDTEVMYEIWKFFKNLIQ
jgi:hypothetical protein